MSPGQSVASLLTRFRFMQCEDVHQNIMSTCQRHSPLILCDVKRNDMETKGPWIWVSELTAFSHVCMFMLHTKH